MDPQTGSLRQKSSFYLPLLLLGGEKRRAMEALYRFCWAADEISDSDSPLAEKKRELALFKRNFEKCLAGKNTTPLLDSLQKTIGVFHLSPEPLRRVIEGVETDLKAVRFQKFSQLRSYALKVAGGPGLASMEIFGFKDKPHRDYAENLGLFLQIVNIVRDFREDQALGRLYLPLEDFRKFHLNPEQLEEKNPQWPLFVEFQLNRAWSFLEKTHRNLTQRQRAELPTAEAIAAVYVKLFKKLKDHPQAILKGRVSLSKADKLLSLAGALGRCRLYGWRSAK